MRALLLRSQSGQWEGLFVDGKLVDEGHSIGEGSAEEFWFYLGQKHQDGELSIKELNIKDSIELEECGNFPEKLSELSGDY